MPSGTDLPGPQGTSVFCGDASPYEALRDVSRFQVKVPEETAEFTGRIKTWDGETLDIEDLLIGVVLGPALRV